MESARAKPGRGSRKFVEPYDFRHPKLISKEIMRSLRSLHEVLGRNLSRIFSSALRRKTEVYLHRIEQISSRKFIQGLESPSVIYILTLEELEGEITVVVPTPFCIHLIERQSGGSGKKLPENRPLTTVEERIVGRTMKSVNRELIEAWEPHMNFRLQSSTFENKPENIHFVSLDPTIVVVLRLEAGNIQVEIKVSYQYSLLKEIMNVSAINKAKHGRTEQLTTQELESYERTLMEAIVPVAPVVGQIRLSLHDILELEEGDVIALDQKTEDPLPVQVNGVEKMTAYPGVLQGRRAVRIYSITEEINEQELV